MPVNFFFACPKVFFVALLACAALSACADDIAVPAASNYVSNGLVGHWDGLENAGRGQHADGAAYWTDLTGKTGDFQVQTAVAALVADGLKKNAAGFAASNGVLRTDVLTAEAVVSGAPSSGWVNALYIRNTQTVTFNNSVDSVGGKRAYFFDFKHYGWATASKPAQETTTVFFNLWDENRQANAGSFLQNGVLPEGTVKTDYWGDANPAGLYIGGRAGYPVGGDAKTTGYTVHAIRLYNRKLARAEVLCNVALDRVRFFGASPDEIPYSFVDGVPKMKLTAVAEAGGGVVLDDSTASAARRVDTGWLALDDSRPHAFRAVPLPGWRFDGWTCDGAEDLVVEGGGASPVVILQPSRNAEVRARFARADAFPDYVSDGLVGRWDGLENAGAGLHDPSTNVWKDLAETAGDLYLVPKVASFTESALRKVSRGVMATNAVGRTDVITAEAAVSDVPLSNLWVNALFLSENQTLSFNSNTGISGGRRQYFVDNSHYGWKSDDLAMPLTFAATWGQDSGTPVGEAIFLNGAPPASGTMSPNYWGRDEHQGIGIGGRIGNMSSGRSDVVAFGYSVNSIRLYNRKLSPGELAFNAALDNVRFFGAPADGLACRPAADGGVACVLRAWTAGEGGRVSLAGGEPSGSVERPARAFGMPDTATFTAVPAAGWKFWGWKGDVDAITSGTTETPTVTVSSARGAALEAVFTSLGRYAADGLIGHWDAIENAGYGHHEASPAAWKDLTGLTGDFLLHPVTGSFSDNALERVRTGRSAQRASKRSGVRTVEAVVSGIPQNNKWVVPVFIGEHQHLTFRDTSATGVRQYFLDYNKTGFTTSDKPVDMTLTVTFRPASEQKAEAVYVNGVQLTGTAYLNWWTASPGMVLGARNDTSNEAGTTGYRIHAVRFYDRVLTPDEIARNARQDALRFFGASPGGTLILVR